MPAKGFYTALGKSPDEVSNAVFGIKQVEESRALTILKNSLNNLDENSEQSLVMRNAYNLSEDLGEEDDEPLLDQIGLTTDEGLFARSLGNHTFEDQKSVYLFGRGSGQQVMDLDG